MPGAIYHLLTVALKGYGVKTPTTLPGSERIHAEGELDDWDAAAGMPPDSTESLTNKGKAQEPAPKPVPDRGRPAQTPESPAGDPEASEPAKDTDHET
jgi:hypothetical protein